MNRNLEGIAITAARECERQQVDESRLVALLTAHLYATRHAHRRPTTEDVREMAYLIEPRTNGVWRQTAVTFARTLNQPADWRDIPDAIERLFATVDRFHEMRPDDVDQFTRAFLAIHPFIDGNGRVAWLLHNWWRISLDDPMPLPDFYFGELATS